MVFRSVQRKSDINFEKLFEKYKRRRWYRLLSDPEEKEWVLIDLAKHRLPKQPKQPQALPVKKTEVLIFCAVTAGCILVIGGLTGLFVLSNGNVQLVVGAAAILATAAGIAGGAAGGPVANPMTAWALYG